MASPRFQLVQGTSAYRTYKWVGWGIVLLLIVLIAFAYADTGSITLLDNDYKLSLTRITKAVSFMVAILGLQVVAGYTGQLSLGQGFFFGTGAYITAWLTGNHGWPVLLTLVVVVPACFLIGMAFGIPALRIRGLYLALVTLGLAAVFPSLILLDVLEPYTGGAAGKSTDYALKAPDWVPLDGFAAILQKIPLIGSYFGDGDLSSSQKEKIWSFFLLTILAAICFRLVANMIKSRPGRAIRAVRDNETSAAVTGINLAYHKTMSFGIASALGGVGGMIYVSELGIASAGDFTQLLSIFFIVGLVVGGVGTLSGAIVGGLAITFIPEWSSSTQELPLIPERWLQGPTGSLFMGLLLIVLTFVLPGGVISGVRQLRAKVVTVRPAPPEIHRAGERIMSEVHLDADAAPVSERQVLEEGIAAAETPASVTVGEEFDEMT